MIRLGLLVGLPLACIRACHLFFMARPASMMASLLPRGEVPTEKSMPEDGAWYSSANMATHLHTLRQQLLSWPEVGLAGHMQKVDVDLLVLSACVVSPHILQEEL